MGAIPNWMWQVGALLKGADMTMDLANNGLQLWDHIDDRVDRSRAQDEMEKVADDPYATTRSFISRNKSKQGKDGSITTSGTDYNAQVNAVRENKLQELARPAQSALDEYASSGIDSMDPAEIVEGYGVALDPRNQYQNAVLNQFRKKQGTIDLLNKGNMAEAVVTDPVALKEYTESRKRAAETGDITQKSDYDRNMGSAAAWLAEQQGGEFADLAPEEKARQLLAGFKLKPQDATNLLESANIYKKIRNVEGGFGKGMDMQYLTDERTGEIVGTVGTPQDQRRRATNLNVGVGLGERSFETELGKQNAQFVAEANKEAAALQEPKALYTELQSLNKMYKTGRTAFAEQKINEVLDYAGVSNYQKLSWAQKYNAVAERIVTSIGATVLKGSQTEREWDMIRKTAATMKSTQGANQYMINQGLAMVKRAEDRARRAARQTNANPYNPTMGLDIAVPDSKTEQPAKSRFKVIEVR